MTDPMMRSRRTRFLGSGPGAREGETADEALDRRILEEWGDLRASSIPASLEGRGLALRDRDEPMRLGRTERRGTLVEGEAGRGRGGEVRDSPRMSGLERGRRRDSPRVSRAEQGWQRDSRGMSRAEQGWQGDSQGMSRMEHHRSAGALPVGGSGHDEIAGEGPSAW